MNAKFKALIACALVSGGVVLAQRTAREADRQDNPTPTWKNDPEFATDVFTFVRAKYSVTGRHGWGHTQDRWAIDFPAGDLNLSYRLQQMTSVRVDPDGLALGFTEKELFEQPFIYLVEPGRLTLEEEEIPLLR